MLSAIRPQPSWRVVLLGSLRAERDGSPVPLTGAKTVSLLAYLILAPRELHRREVIADKLWPDAAPERVRRNFSDALYRLRQTLDAAWLLVEGETLCVRADANLWVDAWEFERLAESANILDLERAVALYQSDLVPEIYDDWLVPTRETFRNQFLSALETLVAQSQARNELTRALTFARRLVTTEPLHEHNHQTYLRLLGRLNRRTEALAHFDYLRQLLQTELQLEPMPETRALAEAIQREATLSVAAATVAERTPFVGRVGERTCALKVVEQALAGRGGVLTVEGEAGIGKSRLLRELGAGARWRGARVAMGSASASPDASPFAPFANALELAPASPRAAQLAALLEPETLAALAPLYPPWGERAPLPELPPAQARERFHRAVVTTVQTLAAAAPLVLMMDDAHWADPALWEMCDAIVPSLQTLRVLLILAYRRPDVETGVGWNHLQRWNRMGYLQTLTLDSLPPEDVAQLLPADLRAETNSIALLTGGNPFFITEYLAMRAEGDVPGRAILTGRLRGLSDETRAALEGAAVLGVQVPFRAWVQVAQQSPLALAAASEQLTAKYFFQPTETGYAFTHDLIRATVYESIAPARRSALHARAADALTALEPSNLRARAFHLDRAGSADQAAAMYAQAAQQALARFAFHEAQSAFEHALALLPPNATRERAETALALAAACDYTGDREPQSQAVAHALDAASQLGDLNLKLQARIAAGYLATKTGQHAAAHAQLDDALALAARLDDAAAQAEIYIELGDLELRTGQVNDAKAHYAQGLILARQAENRTLEALALDGLGFVLPAVGGKPEEAQKYLEQSLAVRRNIGDQMGQARSLANLLAFLQTHGQWDRVLALGDEALALNESVGYRLGGAVVRAALGLAAAALGDFEKARQLVSAAIQDCAAMDDADGVAVYTTSQGQIAARQGKFQEAAALFEQALSLAQAHGAALYAALAQLDLGALYLAQGSHAAALALLEDARAVFIANGDAFHWRWSETLLALALLETNERERASALADENWAAFQTKLEGEDPQYWLWALYRLLAALQRSAEAEAVLRAAFAELQHQARIIREDAARQRFLTCVPVNCEIVAAFDRLTGRVRTLNVRLARRDAPLGSPRRASQEVVVQWTLDAPEDETIADKTARRQYRLRRLLAQAEQQDAAPTDADLAAALRVSRRTILRDMQQLAHAGSPPVTRRRKAQLKIQN